MTDGFLQLRSYSGLNDDILESVCLTTKTLQFNFAQGTFINCSGRIDFLDEAGNCSSYDPRVASSSLRVNDLLDRKIAGLQIVSDDELHLLFITGDVISFSRGQDDGFEHWVLTGAEGKTVFV